MNAAQQKPISESTATPELPVTTIPADPASGTDSVAPPREIGGRGGLDPTRYGDWEKAGRCIDF